MDCWKKMLLIGTTILGAIPIFASTNFYAYANTAETNVFLGQVFFVDVIVKAPELPDEPEIGKIQGFNVTPVTAGSATSEPDTFLFRYAFRATAEGELTIPSLSYLAEEESISTQPLHILAQKPAPTDRMKIENALSKKTVYQGEPVLLTTTWDSTYQFGALKAVDFNHPVMNDKRFQILERYEPEKEKSAQTTGLPVQSTRVLATRKSYDVMQVRHQSLSFSKILIPKKSGKLIIQPSTLLCAGEKEKSLQNKNSRRSAFQYPAYFDNTFFDQNLTGGNYTRIYTESTPVTLDVKPLPVTGRPSLFNGMVGDYTIAATAEPIEVRVGEPVTLTITITAAGFMENIFFQPLRYQPLLVNHFEVPSDRSLPQRTEKSKIYTQTIRPLSTNIEEVPPLSLAYFSPTSNAYVIAQSAPIPLKVLPAEQIGVFGLDSSAFQSRLRSVEEGIRQNYENPDMLENKRRPLLGWAPLALALPVLLLPPLIVGGFALVSLFGERKHHIQRTAKAARAYKVYRKNATHIIQGHQMKSSVYSELDHVLRAYLGDRLHLAPGALTFREVQTRLAETGADTDTLEQLGHLFGLCEAYRFTADYDGAANAKQIIHNASRIVKAVERTLK